MHKCCVHKQTVLYLHSTLFLTPQKCNLLSTGQVTTSLEFRAAGGVWHNPVLSTQRGPPCFGHSSPVNSKAFPCWSPADQRAGQQDQVALQGLPLQLSEEKGEASHKVHVCAMQHSVVCHTMFWGVLKNSLKNYWKKQQHTNQYKL